ncbi:L,D-transpeptidase [Roseovarius salinarum]|uniref:L,D-transpeptidase n=1 Tax=Roseovarius salinarum TaxID=1981892 RepID=UPI0018E4C3CE|nr:L,D-transpeptidase [Roseovarius salinarum]
MIDRRRFLTCTLAAAALGAAAPARGFELEPKFRPRNVGMSARFGQGELLVVPRAHFLYFVTAPGRAIRYGVGVGRAGLQFTGTATIQVKKKWPTWRPTDEMIARAPEEYARFKGNDYVQPGGPDNPLGARALYLFQNGVDTYFRIHGTNAPETIGRSVSNGCIRMLNDHVRDLYERVPIGTKVTVI